MDLKKIVGNEGDFMSLWTVLQDESKKEGILEGEIKAKNKIILAMNKNGLTAEEIAKLTEIPLKEVQEMIRKESE